MLRSIQSSRSTPISYREAFLMTCETVIMCVVCIQLISFVQLCPQFPANRERHIHFSIPPKHSFSPSPQSRSRALIGRFSSIFHRPPLKAHGLTGPQQRRRQSISSNHSPRVVEVPAGRDKQVRLVYVIFFRSPTSNDFYLDIICCSATAMC
jgi:hypothetical protein